MKISFGGAAAGVFLGFALAFLIDTTDRSFHTEKEIIQQIRVPVALAVPLMLTAAEERRRRWKTVLEWCGASVLLLAVAAAEFYVYRRG